MNKELEVGKWYLYNQNFKHWKQVINVIRNENNRMFLYYHNIQSHGNFFMSHNDILDLLDYYIEIPEHLAKLWITYE